ncbi:hypothetical protein H9L10_08110 [Phycicoccus endophyticus]|uniref:Uncharacterized protein n=1 Tax=Phycicoccus endophyticus TaxID=1690220 RepID=A0A7G9QY95_9MICO|nr:hypothetical protein [Phycicoccus endophyticus]NHI19211.1 hypothetical protein [Phycicoccus endophyticus]QNN48320.1 hypothetical protein H9L10_08110 [Phycicoccus endophyticus]GGL41005.1 hypothetical protein GCM10012283_24460 [Phycicoccus endophyticus]
MSGARRASIAPILAALLVVATTTVASATTVKTTKYYPYSQNRYFKSTHLKTCFTANLSGRIQVVFSKNTASPATTAFTNYTLVNPTLNVQARNCSTGKLKTMSKWRVKQSWWDYKCSLHASVSAGFPWGISVSATPNCGRTRTANRQTGYGRVAQVTQFNSGAPVHLGSIVRAQSGRCFSAGTTVTAWSGGRSDTFNLRNYKICYSK